MWSIGRKGESCFGIAGARGDTLNDVHLRNIALTVVATMCSWQPPTASAAMSNTPPTIVHGRCIRCAPRLQLGKFHFLDAFDGWAEGFVMTVSNGHISQSGTILHTTDGGKTWKPLTGIETYGVEVEPAFSFINRRQGWIAWPRTDGDDRIIQTEDGGRNWRNLRSRLNGMP